MKTRLLALLLCLVLVASALLMTACGGEKVTTGAVTGEEAQEAALSDFLQGLDKIAEGGIAFTGTVKGSFASYDYDMETRESVKTTESIDLNIALNYFNYAFDMTAAGKVSGEDVDVELFFDGEMVATYDKDPETEQGEEAGPAYNIFFLEDVMSDLDLPAGAALPSMLMTGEDADMIASMKEFYDLIDYDKLSGLVNPLTSSFIVFDRVDKNTYKVTFSSDALFDAVINLLTIVKDNKDGTVGELIDALLGEGTVDKIKAELDKYHGTDKLKDLLPKLEEFLGDLGLKVDAAYDYAAKMYNQLSGAPGDQAMTGTAMREKVLSLCAELTVNDAIKMAFSFEFGMGNDDDWGEGDLGEGDWGDYDWEDDGEEYEFEGEVDQLESAMPGMPIIPGIVSPIGEDGEVTYESIKASVVSFMNVKLSDLATLLEIEDIGETMDTSIAYATAFKAAFKINASVTTDKNLVPTGATLKIEIDTTGLPEEMEIDEAQITIDCSAQIKSTLTIAPVNATLKTKIDEAKAAKKTPESTEAVTED